MKDPDFSNTVKVLDLTKRTMSCAGIWPEKTRERVFMFYATYLTLQCSLAVVDVTWNISDFTYVVSSLLENVFNLMALLKITLCRIKSKSLFKFLEDIRGDFLAEKYDSTEEKMAFLNYNQFSLRFVTLTLTFTVVTAWTYYLMSLATNIEMAMQLVGNTFQLCLLGYHTLLSQTEGEGGMLFTFFLVISCISSTLLAYCYMGECLITESSILGDSFYQSEWYNISRTEKKLMQICMMRSTKQMQLSSGKFCTLSLSTFSDVLKSSMAYFSVLRSME
ncbi:hypothetical protein KPH14_002614 [Odynerus spinipes]|uniref:Odorant receptor n=1 Tax=Odynerus spinipes TaxID=1348599 RepID=A0AAD9VHM3_9HYME|nr:hypothetical protein KPH14_002614 [Odynerus spinipes]